MEKKQKKRSTGESSQAEFKADHVLDLRGVIMPLSLLKITHAFRNLENGETVDIVGTDLDTRRDFLKVLGKSSCEVLHINAENGRYFIRLRKGKIGKEV
jgi:TusA-related sulfurtransferase